MSDFVALDQTYVTGFDMISEKNIKTILMILVLISLFVYMAITEGIPLIFGSVFQGQPSSIASAYSVLRIGAIIVSLFTLATAINLQFITRWVLGDNYIAGMYSGVSHKITKDNGIENTHREEFEIKQSLVSTKISGKSLDEHGRYYSVWHGYLVDYDNRHYEFLVRLETTTKELMGIMKFNIFDKELHGFALSIGNESEAKWKFEATRAKVGEIDTESKVRWKFEETKGK